jgi:hypothetical protein
MVEVTAMRYYDFNPTIPVDPDQAAEEEANAPTEEPELGDFPE